MWRTKNVPAAAAVPLAAEEMPEPTATTTKAASQVGRTFIASQGSASSATGRFGFSRNVYMPAMPMAAEKMMTTTPDVTMLHFAPASVWAQYMVNRRPGSATTLTTSTVIRLKMFQPPKESTPKKE